MIPHLSWEMTTLFLWEWKRPSCSFEINQPVSRLLPLYLNVSFSHLSKSQCSQVVSPTSLQWQKQREDSTCRMERRTGENRRGAAEDWNEGDDQQGSFKLDEGFCCRAEFCWAVVRQKVYALCGLLKAAPRNTSISGDDCTDFRHFIAEY